MGVRHHVKRFKVNLAQNNTGDNKQIFQVDKTR